MSDFQRFGDPFGAAASLARAYQAWWSHPVALGEQWQEIGQQAGALFAENWCRYWGRGVDDTWPALRQDERFQDPAWTENPWLDALKEGYLLFTRTLQDVTYRAPGLSDEERRQAAFWQRQLLNALAPTNYFFLNPTAVRRALESGGYSVWKGMQNLARDLDRGLITMSDESAFRVGDNLANTPGEVVFRNHLMELIHYQPTTPSVHVIPIVLVAPWINKYYILDLTPENSLIRYLVEQGFTVFVTSWRNPGADLGHTTMDDYLEQGALKAVEVAREICAGSPVHLAGYCLGGTLVAALMAWLNAPRRRNGSCPVAHWTLLTTLVEFSAPGDIEVYIDEHSIDFLDRRMARHGYLDGTDMAYAFRTLRSNSLIWRYVVHNYLYGESPEASDILYWNMDTTRLPHDMHRYYLREFYLRNRLVGRGTVRLAGRRLDLRRIEQPLYAVGTEQDHIAPWPQTFRIRDLVRGPVRYVLSTSGHILGIVNPPLDPPRRGYRAGDPEPGTGSDDWQAAAEKTAGSWWQDWSSWLHQRCGEQGAAPQADSAGYAALAPAPGPYVLER
jgi:polyhydroxyalkanoate synthase